MTVAIFMLFVVLTVLFLGALSLCMYMKKKVDRQIEEDRVQDQIKLHIKEFNK